MTNPLRITKGEAVAGVLIANDDVTAGDDLIVGDDASVAGDLTTGTIAVGASGSVIKKIAYATVSINPASISTVSRAVTPFTITGARVGDMLIVSPPATLNDDLLFVGAKVTGDDEGSIYLYNPTGGSIDDAAATWQYVWIDLT